MGGPGSGRKAQLTAQELTLRLRSLSETAFAVIKNHLNARPVTDDIVDSAWKVVEHVKGKPVQPTLDETPKEPNPFEGWPVEEVRAVLEVLRSFQGRPADLELFLAQARVAAREKQEAKA